MRWFRFCSTFLLLAAQAAAQTALRPDQIQPGSPDITTGMSGNYFQIGTTIPWRTDSTTTPLLCRGSGDPAGCTASDNAMTVELTNSGAITATLPDATGLFSDGAGFTIQVGPGTLTLNRQSSSTISGDPSIVVGPYQAVTLASRGANWYAMVSAPITAGAGGGPSAWNTSDKASGVALSTTTVANDTATAGTVTSWQAVRGTASHPCCTGAKWVFTLTVTAVDTGTNGWIGGIGGSTLPLTYPGSASPGYGIQAAASGGADYTNGTPISASPACSMLNFAAGNVVWLAFDFGTGKAYCSKNCTTWANSGNPDSATGPTVTGLTAATYFPMWGGEFGTIANKAVLNTKPTLSGCTGLTTFSQWG
jgi:hypothetical protein